MSYLHSTAPMQRTPQGWCKDCCLLWSLSSGRKQASSSSCCQHHWATLAPSFLLCTISLCVIRAIAVVSCQWPVPKVPSPISAWSYLGLPSCHQDIFSGCRSRTYTTSKQGMLCKISATSKFLSYHQQSKQLFIIPHPSKSYMFPCVYTNTYFCLFKKQVWEWIQL